MMVIKRRIQDIMDEKPRNTSVPALFLYIFSKCYGCVVTVRNFLFDRHVVPVRKLPCKVFSIGNLCVGGTGKTPMTMYTARLLKDMGYRVCIISRGYKGSAERSGGVVTDGKTLLMDATAAGDEPYMMAKRLGDIPVIMGKDRYDAGMKAVSLFCPDVILLDDGFQHRRLYRDMDMVLLDYGNPLGNGHLLPRGRLREPAKALFRSHAVIFTRTPDREKGRPMEHISVFLDDRFKGPVFCASHKPRVFTLKKKNENTQEKTTVNMDGEGFDCLKDRRVFAFSGIADNNDFKNTIEVLGGHVIGHERFDDHHRYTEKDIRDIARKARASEADMLVTTEKDHVRIPHDMAWPLDFAVIDVDISFGKDADAFKECLVERLEMP